MAYDRIEPFGDFRADLRAAIIAATVANHSMSPPKKPRSPADFMPKFDGPRKSSEPILLADPKAQAALIRKAVFRMKD